jgi:hypothetical protein
MGAAEDTGDNLTCVSGLNLLLGKLHGKLRSSEATASGGADVMAKHATNASHV